MTTVRDATYTVMRELGLTTVFGNPGSTEEAFLADFPADLRYVLALQEASAMSIADGYAQGTGRAAMVNLHSAAGVGNAMGNLMTAFLNRTPLVVTAGQQTRQMLLNEPWLTNVDPTTLPRPWVKWAYEPARPQDVPAALLRAYLTAVQPPAGPVFLSLPVDDWEQQAGVVPARRSVSTRFAPDPGRLEELTGALRDAVDPALVLGAGVDRAGGWDRGVQLAEALAAAVYAPPASELCAFPENHPLFRGVLPFAIGPLAEQLRGHDVVVVVGAPVFRYYPYVPGEYLPTGTTVWHVTDDPAEAARAPVGEAVLADPALVLGALAETFHDDRPRGATRRPVPPARETPPPPDYAGPLAADTVFAVLDELRRPDTVLVAESPSNLAALHARWQVVRPRSYFTMASGALGFGLPAAVGLSMAERDTGRSRPVLAVIGDGSFQYSVQSLYTAAQHQLPLTVVVPANGDYAILKSFAQTDGLTGVPGLDLPGLDIAGTARGFGAHAERVHDVDELRTAVRDASQRPGPTVLEVPIRAEVPDLL